MGNLIQPFGTLDELAQSLADQSAAAAPTDTVPGSADLITQTSQILWETAKVQPPSNLYVTSSDRIQVSYWTVGGQPELDIAGRLLEPDGSIKLLSFQIPISGVSLPGTFTFQIAEGFLLDLVATCPTSFVQRGTLFVQVAIVRGNTSNPTLSHVLIQDYVWTKSICQWPGSPVRDPREGPGTIISTLIQPAQGTDWTFSNSQNTRARVRMVQAILQTAAAVANRLVVILILNGSGTQIASFGGQFSQVASNSYQYSIGPGLQLSTAAIGFPQICLPADLMLDANWSIKSATLNIQPLDSWQNVYVTTESWISP